MEQSGGGAVTALGQQRGWGQIRKCLRVIQKHFCSFALDITGVL